MTREAIEQRIESLECRREQLIDHLLDPDRVSSSSLTSEGGSTSVSNLSPEQTREQIRFLDRELNRLRASIGLVPRAGTLSQSYIRSVG